ncbi:hypothetical protein K493DRAFT_412670 [Basidiobolus meristosporus CBS 931.73]|uniref:BZIP domain-containing protein n=1 Tax=Basidiobolus meristosporus CBS 931.73 TaxID=1314790 RepID=A0A1Y1WNL3_9FUNG|nr:hypothetical protein K493DRAFT_412670 [Basidiobolus meristosporus CBS 931.73]|eukprot:ORX75062.1 hypothetical protein K493DRAFT_412670 [Basidiobolus meristosporus CBS 931.73]
MSRKRDRSEEETPLSSELLSRKPGRKPVATAPISKRQMQNREAQRLFRERKIRQQQHLYDRIQELEDIRDTTQRENYHLKLVAQELQVQNERLQATLKNVCTENNSSNCAPFPVDGDKPNSSDFQASFQTQGPWRYTNIKPLIHKPSTAVQDPTPRPEDISIATKHTHRTIEYAASRTNEPGLCERARKAREEREAIESTEYRASRDSVYPIQPNDRPPPGPSTRSAAHTTEAQFRNAVEAGANDGIYSLVDQIAHSTANEDPSMAQQSNINYQYNALSVTPNTDQHSNMNLPTLTPDSLEALSADDGVSVAYLDQLVMELHDLCQEMKKKAALSSEPFEFEWPCEEIDQKLQKMKEFKP